MAAAATRRLPEDIQIEILYRCPVKSLLRLRCVCKRWRSLIFDPQFVQLHLTQSNLSLNLERLLIAPHAICKTEHAPYNHRYLQFVGTCNGLVCFNMSNEEIIVFNPSTKYYQELPLPPLEEGRGLNQYFSWGFGYDSASNDYKVVLGLQGPKFLEKIMVFNFKDNVWRIKPEFDENDGISLRKGADPVLLNGGVHWIGNTGVRDKIHCFDLSEEVMKEILTPNELQWFGEIGLVGTSLSVSKYGWDGSKYGWDGVGGWILNVWVMKEYDVQTSWVILYKIPDLNYLFSRMLSLRNGEICVGFVRQDESFNLVAYYPWEGKRRAIESFRVADAFEGGWVILGYKESLVSPNCGRDWKGGNPQFTKFMTKNVLIFDVESLEKAN